MDLARTVAADFGASLARALCAPLGRRMRVGAVRARLREAVTALRAAATAFAQLRAPAVARLLLLLADTLARTSGPAHDMEDQHPPRTGQRAVRSLTAAPSAPPAPLSAAA